MPAGLQQQIDRLVDGRLNAGTGDTTPGQSVSSGTGQSSYGGNVGSRLAIDAAGIRFQSSVGTLFGGIYQYVFMTYTTNQPARGQFVSWDLSVAEALFQVNGDAKPSTAIPTLIAGVVINSTVVKNTYAWMQIGGRASCLFDSGITAAAAGNPVSPKQAAAVASTFDVGAFAAAYAQANANQTGACIVGIAETLPVLSTISVVQLNNTLAFRRI